MGGAVFGDHCSPISDTTILASTGSSCNHIKHVSTQLPYAVTVASSCFIGYLLTGFITESVFKNSDGAVTGARALYSFEALICLPISAAILITLLIVLPRVLKKRTA